MSIEFARTSIIGRSSGHSAVKASAYRSGERLFDDRTGLTADYSHRADEVRHSEILLPDGADPTLLDRQTLWTAVEEREDQHNRRASAQLAKDHVIALPRELSHEEQVALARDFAQSEFVSQGLVVDLAIHDHSKGNPHAHLMTTTRILEGGRFTEKARGANGAFYGGQKVPEAEQLRHRWAEFQNAWARERGYELGVMNHDGTGYAAEVHLGPTEGMQNRGVETDLTAVNDEIRDARTRTILENPAIVIDRVSDRKSLFTRNDLYRAANALVSDPESFATLKARLDVHESLRIIRTRVGDVEKEFLTTDKVLELESTVRAVGARLGASNARFEIETDQICTVLDRRSMLSEEQRAAALHLVAGNRLGLVVGLAGAGKSTMLDAVREAYTLAGHRVQGLALAGKAADELSQSAGIESRTIASWLMALDHERAHVESGDVYIVDEAGMVDNRTMMRVLDAAERGGAKVVLVGDGEQLQAIRAGCPFRDLGRQEGYAEIATIRRQRANWMREATKDLARGRASHAVARYRDAGRVHRGDSGQMFERLVSDYLASGERSKAILAHRNTDVDELNRRVREARQAAGELTPEQDVTQGVHPDDVVGMPIDLQPGDRVRFESADPSRRIVAGESGTYLGEAAGVHRVETDRGDTAAFTREKYDGTRHAVEEDRLRRRFAKGDRVLFTSNDRTLGVKNGMLGDLIDFRGRVARVQIDDGPIVEVDDASYPHLEYGYATTIHKAQGMTVDQAFVLGSSTMDKHLGYVAMSRHRERLDVYLPDEQFMDKSFESVISRTRRQESALDLATEHGYESVIIENVKRDTQTNDQAWQQEVERMAETVQVGQGALSSEAVGTQAQQEGFAAAADLISQATAHYEQQIANAHSTALDKHDQVLSSAREALDRHDELEPGKGIFQSKVRHQEWKDQRDALEREVKAAEASRTRVQDQWQSERHRHPIVARQRAEAQFPDAAKALQLQHDLSAGQKDLARMYALERQREPQAEKSRADIDRQIDVLARSLANNKAFSATLSKEQRVGISQARERSSNALKQERGRSMDR